jgi:hypothetical protein
MEKAALSTSTKMDFDRDSIINLGLLVIYYPLLLVCFVTMEFVGFFVLFTG